MSELKGECLILGPTYEHMKHLDSRQELSRRYDTDSGREQGVLVESLYGMNARKGAVL